MPKSNSHEHFFRDQRNHLTGTDYLIIVADTQKRDTKPGACTSTTEATSGVDGSERFEPEPLGDQNGSLAGSLV